MNIRKLVTGFFLSVLLAFGAEAATYTTTVGTTDYDTGGALTIPMPAGSLDGKLILIYSASVDFNGRTLSAAPAGYTELAFTQPGTNKASYLWGKIGTASETSKTVTWASGNAAGWAIAVESSTGWDAIGSVLAGYTTGSTTSPAGGMIYQSRTTLSNDNFIVQLGKRPSPGSPTAITVTSGWTSAGAVLETGLAAAGQWRQVSGNASANSVTMTGGSGTNATGGMTVEFAPAVVTGPTLTLSDATPDIDTTVTATLSGAFGAGGNPTTATFASGDTVACTSATSTTCDFPLNWAALSASGDLGSTQVASATTVTITNGTETSQSSAVTLQMPVSGYSLVDLTCTFGVDCTEDTKAISPMVVGDDCAIKVTSGTLSELSSHCAPVFNSRVGAYSIARFDESAGAWLGQTEYLFISNSVTPGVESDITDDIQDDINTDITGDSL